LPGCCCTLRKTSGMFPCPPCSITWRCLVAPKFNILRQPNRRARTVAAVPPLRRSQARHPPDVMITRFCPASLTPPRPRSSPLLRPPAGRPLPSTGVGTTAATARTAGEIRIVANDFDGPNGLAFSLNETRLYIAEISAFAAPIHSRFQCWTRCRDAIRPAIFSTRSNRDTATVCLPGRASAFERDGFELLGVMGPQWAAGVSQSWPSPEPIDVPGRSVCPTIGGHR
jgi:hypothetical protein